MNSIGATVTDLLDADKAWKYVFLVSLIAMVVSKVIIAAHFPSYIRQGSDPYSTLPLSHQTWSLPRIAKFLSIIVAALLLQLALYYGAIRGWGNTLSIGLSIASGFFLAAFIVKQSWDFLRSSRSSISSETTVSSTKASMVMLLCFSWGIGFHTFEYFMRK